MELPAFKYHPDPIATGSIEPSTAKCACCGQKRGFIYTGPIYNPGTTPTLCPWCIADGSAHTKYDATFTDEAGIGGGGQWDEVSSEIIAEVATRTPGFNGWQQEQWWTHCGDAAAFIGRAGHAELLKLGPQAIEAIRENTGLPLGAQWNKFLAALDKDGSFTAYMFRCTKCGLLGGYQDCD